MKKVLIFFIAIFIVIALVACHSTTPEGTATLQPLDEPSVSNEPAQRVDLANARAVIHEGSTVRPYIADKLISFLETLGPDIHRIEIGEYSFIVLYEQEATVLPYIMYNVMLNNDVVPFVYSIDRNEVYCSRHQDNIEFQLNTELQSFLNIPNATSAQTFIEYNDNYLRDMIEASAESLDDIRDHLQEYSVSHWVTAKDTEYFDIKQYDFNKLFEQYRDCFESINIELIHEGEDHISTATLYTIYKNVATDEVTVSERIESAVMASPDIAVLYDSRYLNVQVTDVENDCFQVLITKTNYPERNENENGIMYCDTAPYSASILCSTALNTYKLLDSHQNPIAYINVSQDFKDPLIYIKISDDILDENGEYRTTFYLQK